MRNQHQQGLKRSKKNVQAGKAGRGRVGGTGVQGRSE